MAHPTYTLGWTRCPCCCGGEGFVGIIMCPDCKTLFGVCDEVDTLITDLKTLTMDGVTYDPVGRLCPSCHAVPVATFVPANFDRLTEDGFSESDIYRWPEPFAACCSLPTSSRPITYAEHLAQKEKCGSDGVGP